MGGSQDENTTVNPNSSSSNDSGNNNNDWKTVTMASAGAGVLARIATHPLDTVKARLQATSGAAGLRDAARQTWRQAGLRGFYRGFGTVVVGGTPGTVLYLSSYEWLKTELSSLNHNTNTFYSDLAVHFSAGMGAEAVACLIYVPVDVLKERKQVAGSTHSMNTAAAWTTTNTTSIPQHTMHHNYNTTLQSILRNEGIVGIYRGYAATLGSFGPFSAIYFVLYERLKQWSQEQQHHQSQRAVSSTPTLPFPWLVFCSCTAGGIASFLTSPLDMAKLRLQVQRGLQQLESQAGQTPQYYRGVGDCLTDAFQRGGVWGLFRGAGARVLHFAPATTITMTSFELLKDFFGRTL